MFFEIRVSSPKMIEKVILKKFAFLSFEQYSLFDILNSYILWKSAEAQFPQRREREKSGEDYTIYREVLSDLRGREGRGPTDFRIDEPANNLRSLSGRVEAIYRRLACFQRAVCRRISARIEILENTSTGFFPPFVSLLPLRGHGSNFYLAEFPFLNFRPIPADSIKKRRRVKRVIRVIVHRYHLPR